MPNITANETKNKLHGTLAQIKATRTNENTQQSQYKHNAENQKRNKVQYGRVAYSKDLTAPTDNPHGDLQAKD